jgi:hypothetical protein
MDRLFGILPYPNGHSDTQRNGPHMTMKANGLTLLIAALYRRHKSITEEPVN